MTASKATQARVAQERAEAKKALLEMLKPDALQWLRTEASVVVMSKQRRGFALISSDRMRTIASAGGQAAARSGHAYKFTGAVARTAGKLGAEVRMAPWWSDSSGRVSLRIILDDALPCTRAGAQDATVHALSHKPYVHRQLRQLDAADVRAALRPWGAWTEYELRDHAANLQRVLWLAACEIAERKGML